MALIRSFGRNPSGAELEFIAASPEYKNGIFENESPTQMMTGNSSMIKLMWKFFNKPKDATPSKPLPSLKTDLRSLKYEKPVIIWFGHSSYFIRINGKNILVDPVLCGRASPFFFGGGSFPGSDIYTPFDFPEIDMLIITHDHYDHLDHRTVSKLKNKIKAISTSLGVGSHLQYWGFDKNSITEFDWWQHKQFADDFELIAAPARHFSGRSLTRNKTLWSSFIFKAGNYNIYIGADSGYDQHFKTIGEKYGPFDLAILETGQYNEQWALIHMMPEQAVQATIELNAKTLMPVHWAKFALAYHAWQEPVERVLAKAWEMNVPVTTPMIGEPVVLNESYPTKHWWK